VQLIADVSVNLTFKAENVPELFATFRKDANGIVVGYVRDRIRNAMNDEGAGYTAMELVSTKQEEFMGHVNQRLARELEEKGILLDSVSLLKRPTPPPKVDEAINMALAATQQAIAAWNQVEQTKAQAEQVIQEAKGKAEAARQAADGAAYAQMAKAKADAYTIQVAKEAEAKGNLELSQSITPSLVEYLRVKQWNGSVPYISGGGALPLINLPAPKTSQ
jgi:regulator of protease activity HflC (stomatin/prohibitin superfamily)